MLINKNSIYIDICTAIMNKKLAIKMAMEYSFTCLFFFLSFYVIKTWLYYIESKRKIFHMLIQWQTNFSINSYKITNKLPITISIINLHTTFFNLIT